MVGVGKSVLAWRPIQPMPLHLILGPSFFPMWSLHSTWDHVNGQLTTIPTVTDDYHSFPESDNSFIHVVPTYVAGPSLNVATSISSHLHVSPRASSFPTCLQIPPRSHSLFLTWLFNYIQLIKLGLFWLNLTETGPPTVQV